MKRIFLSALVALTLAACQQKKTEQSSYTSADGASAIHTGDAANGEFEKTTYDFGSIKQGEIVQYDFKFKNVGKSPLIITAATATCGCTVPQYPQEPIKPGDTGVIKVVFDSHGKIDKQDKIVTITSNAVPELEKLHLVGEVKAK